jgi:hypothetical protein
MSKSSHSGRIPSRVPLSCCLGILASLAMRIDCSTIRKMFKTKEHIIHEAGNREAWVCLCGNQPDYDGFFPCDEEGNEMEPVEGWKSLYVCFRCGRIIHQDSLEVVGRNGNLQRLN